MTKNRYEIIADKATEVFLSNTTNEEQERQFSELVKNEDQNILFAGMIYSVFEKMKIIPMESASVLLDKFIVNSLLNGMVSPGGGLNNKQTLKLILDFLDSKVPDRNIRTAENQEDLIHAESIVNSITFIKFFEAKKEIIKNGNSEKIQIPWLQYYIDNYEKIKEVEKAIRIQDMANLVNSYDKSVRQIYSIFKSELPEVQKEIMYNDTVDTVSYEIHKKNKPFLESLLKKINTLEVNEANEFFKKAVSVIDSKGYSIGKYAAEIGIPIFEASEIDEHAKQIKNSNKPSLK